jgi:NADH:ubiquinone oxidoreductase subunit
MKGEAKVGALVGVDQLGNHFYEDTEAQFGRNRWVEYAGLPWWADVEATAIGADWHGWLHQMTDLPGDNYLLKEAGQITQPVDSDVLYHDNLGGVQDKHQINQSFQRPRGFYGSKIKSMGGATPANYWRQPGHPMSEKGVTHDRESEFWKPSI